MITAADLEFAKAMVHVYLMVTWAFCAAWVITGIGPGDPPTTR